MRSDPQCFIPILEEMLLRFDGKRYKIPGKDHSYLLTNEGAPAVQEFIDFLRKQKPLPVQEWQQDLQKAPRDHVLDQGPKGMVGHDGSDGS